MSTVKSHAEEVHTHAHDHDHEHEHHELNFWTKYIFSTDHKTIAKQYLISGILWAVTLGSDGRRQILAIDATPVTRDDARTRS
jgi:cytochrome c oxidase subunit 1